MTQTEFSLDIFETTREGYLTKARNVARELLTVREWITIDDVRDLAPPPDGVDPRVMGAVFKKSDFESLGYVASKRKECHKRPVQKFRVKQVRV